MGLYGKKYKVDDVNVRAFLALAATGLWGRSVKNAFEEWGRVDWDRVIQLAREQALVGIVASAFDAGDLGFELQDGMDRSLSKALAKKVYSIEQRNLKMYSFVEKLFEKFEANGLHPVLLKGQGVAQSYLNPLRRNPGDVDVLLAPGEYEIARMLLLDKASKVIADCFDIKQTALVLSGFIVELHGALRLFLGKKIEAEMDSLHNQIFAQQKFRTVDFSGLIGSPESGYKVKLPEINIDVLYVFCHILQHFFTGGIGLRQVCDLCRLLYCYRDEIDKIWLKSELQKLGFMAEWKAFGAMAVDYLGMKAEYVPFYDLSSKWHRKARRIMAYILSTGNMGKNRDQSYKKKYPYLVKKLISLTKIISNFWHLARIFPGNAALVSFKGVREGMTDLADGQ